MLLEKLQLYAMAGDNEKYFHQRLKVNKFTSRFPYLFLNQEIKNFPLIGNAFCLVLAMKTASGQNLNYQPYSDGKFDLLVNGQKVRDRISASELVFVPDYSGSPPQT